MLRSANAPRFALALALPLISIRLGSAALVSPLRAAAPPTRCRPLCQMPSPLPPYLIELQEELAAGEAQLFDVREPNEYAVGALAQSFLVPLSALQVRARAARLGPRTWRLPPLHTPHSLALQAGIEPGGDGADKAKLTYVHCAAGKRAQKAKPILEAMGYERVVSLGEGFAALRALDFPLKS